MRYISLAALVPCAVLLLAGCSQPGSVSGTPLAALTSPVVGTWSGQAKLATGNTLVKIKNALSGDKMTGDSRLTLKADGTGFLKIAKQPERAVVWRQEGHKLILQPQEIGADGTVQTSATDKNSYVGTLSEDGKTITLDMGEVKVSLLKQGSGTG